MTDSAGTASTTSGTATNGDYLLGYYLPGDADGDGIVNQNDLRAIAAAMGSKAGDARYNFEADANRDGKIDSKDLALAKQNLGVQTKIQPSVTANLDPASDSGTLDRITVYQDVIFEGTGTPGATVTYSETGQKAPDLTATIKPDGTYTLTEHLAEGSNTFKVTSVDGFGQKITGTIQPVTYQTPETPVTSPTTPKSPPTALYPTATAEHSPRQGVLAPSLQGPGGLAASAAAQQAAAAAATTPATTTTTPTTASAMIPTTPTTGTTTTTPTTATTTDSTTTAATTAATTSTTATTGTTSTTTPPSTTATPPTTTTPSTTG